MTDEGWQRTLRIMDEAFEEYPTGMSTLRKRVVGDVKRKLRDRTPLDHPRHGARSKPIRGRSE